MGGIIVGFWLCCTFTGSKFVSIRSRFLVSMEKISIKHSRYPGASSLSLDLEQHFELLAHIVHVGFMVDQIIESEGLASRASGRLFHFCPSSRWSRKGGRCRWFQTLWARKSYGARGQQLSRFGRCHGSPALLFGSMDGLRGASHDLGFAILRSFKAIRGRRWRRFALTVPRRGLGMMPLARSLLVIMILS